MKRTANLTRILALCLALCLLIGTTALADRKDHINYDGYRPIVKEGHEVTLTMAVEGWDDWAWSDPEQNWAVQFIRQKLNINLETTMILSSQLSEKKNLMFASDDIPDILLISMGTGDYVRYGMQEQQLLPLDEYINADTMPIYYEALNKEGYEALGSLKLEDGHMYAFGTLIVDPLNASHANVTAAASQWFVDSEFLEASGMAAPTTVDEFTELLRAYKKANPDKIALAGAIEWTDPRIMLYNALGYTSTDYLGLAPAMRGGEAIVPAAQDDYKYVLETMNTWYTEGLLAEDYVTMDEIAGEALVLEGNFVALPVNGMWAFYEDGKTLSRWTPIAPLTSETWTTPTMPADLGGVTYTGALSYSCADIDAALRFMDYWLYSMEGVMYRTDGPLEGSEDCLGMISGEYYNVETNEPESFKDVDNGMHILDYLCGKVFLSVNGFGSVMLHEDENITNWRHLYQVANGLEPQWKKTYNTDTLDGYWRSAVEEVSMEYFTSTFPTLYFLSEEDNNYISDMATVLEKYISSETAKFITGARPLDEFEAFQEELKEIGIEEYQAFYVDLYSRISE